MEGHKTHKRHEEIKEDAVMTEQAVEVEVKEHKNTHNKHKKVIKERAKPSIGQKVKLATYTTLAATERIINGFAGIYEKVFVGPPNTLLNFHKEEGLKCFDGGDYEGAIAHFISYVEETSDHDAEVLFLLGESHIRLDQNKEALEYLKKAEALEKDDPDIVTELAGCLISLENYPEALSYLKKCIELYPDNAENYYHMGTCCEKTGQPEEAKKMYKKAIDLNPREAVYYQALGFVYENSDNHKDAIVCFKKAMDLDRKSGGGVTRKVKERVRSNI